MYMYIHGGYKKAPLVVDLIECSACERDGKLCFAKAR